MSMKVHSLSSTNKTDRVLGISQLCETYKSKGDDSCALYAPLTMRVLVYAAGVYTLSIGCIDSPAPSTSLARGQASNCMCMRSFI
jgi:hypothetical protein